MVTNLGPCKLCPHPVRDDQPHLRPNGRLVHYACYEQMQTLREKAQTLRILRGGDPHLRLTRAARG